MATILRCLVVYAVLLVLFRLSGKRALHKATVFDLVLVLVIAETVQTALVGDDPSLTRATVVATTLVLVDVVLSYAKQRSARLDRWLDGLPLTLVEEGVPVREALERSRVDEADIRQAARELHGLATMDDVRFAVLEKDGRISIVPRTR
jgi:uncharacterized membrane protein YcaP (DUF421 family)